MRVIYEVNDIVVIKDDYRDWKKGELALITKIEFEHGSGLQFVKLLPINKSEKDIKMLYAYQVKPTRDLTKAFLETLFPAVMAKVIYDLIPFVASKEIQ